MSLTFQDYAGVENCDYCNVYTEVYEWLHSSGKTLFLCRKCRSVGN